MRNRLGSGRIDRVLVFTVTLLTSITRPARPQVTSSARAAVTAKPFTFEVVSIRPNPPNAPFNPMLGQVTPSGFRARLNLFMLLMTAYTGLPPGQWMQAHTKGLPDWSGRIWYDIEARVAPADLNAWQKQDRSQPLLHAALQAMLRERFKLSVSEETSPVPAYELVVSRKGPRLKPADPKALPTPGPMVGKLASGGARIAEGRTTWHYYSATMGDLQEFLANTSGGRPLADHTGLTGRYDFTIGLIDEPVFKQDQGEPVYNWPVDSLGLQVRRTTAPGLTLNVKHVEPPTPN